MESDEIDDMEEEDDDEVIGRDCDEEEELAMFTGDGVGKLADDITTAKKQQQSALPQMEDAKDGQSHFKTVLKELEENVSEDDEDEEDDDENSQ